MPAARMTAVFVDISKFKKMFILYGEYTYIFSPVLSLKNFYVNYKRLCLTDEQLNLLFTITLIKLSRTYYPNLEDNLKNFTSMNNRKIFNRDNFSETKMKKLEARILLNLNVTVFKNLFLTGFFGQAV